MVMTAYNWQQLMNIMDQTLKQTIILLGKWWYLFFQIIFNKWTKDTIFKTIKDKCISSCKFLLLSMWLLRQANNFWSKKYLSDICIILLSKAKKHFDMMDVNDQRETYITLRRFVRFYEFLLQVSSFHMLIFIRNITSLFGYYHILRLENQVMDLTLREWFKQATFIKRKV